MFRRALSFIKQICLRRGSILYLPAFSSFIANNFENRVLKSHTFNLRDHLHNRQNVSRLHNTSSIFSTFFFFELNTNISKTEELFQSKIQTLLSNLNLDNNIKNPFHSFFNIKDNNKIRSLLSDTQSKPVPRTLREFLLSLRQKRTDSFFIPEALFITNTRKYQTVIRECIKLQIPIIAIIDSNSTPFGIQYPIPGNEDSIDSLLLYTEIFYNTLVTAKKDELKRLLLN